MVIKVFTSIPLSSHTSVAHDNIRILRQGEPKQMGRDRPFIDPKTAFAVIGDPGCVCPSGLTRGS